MRSVLGLSFIDCSKSTGYEDTQDGLNNAQHTREGNGGFYSPEKKMDPLLIIQTCQNPEPEEEGICYGILQGAENAEQSSSRYHDQSLRERSCDAVPMESQTAISSRTDHTEDNEDGCNNLWNATEVNPGVSSAGNEIDSLLTQREEGPETEERGFPHGVLDKAARESQGTCRAPEEWQSEHPPEDVAVEALMLPSQSHWTPSQSVPLFQDHEANSTRKGHRERHHRDMQTHKCDECPQTFKYPSRLLAHQRRHRKERTVFCSSCAKGFYNYSDLRVHQVIHQQKKPFTCSTCERSFSHKTNLHAHERIHTGEKPYTCSLCNRSFRQSSTYNRHLRNCRKLY